MTCYIRLCICIGVLVCIGMHLLFKKNDTYHRSFSKASSLASFIKGSLLPQTWSWILIRNREAIEYKKNTGKELTLGFYASLVVDQHRSMWCGCCYMISALQMIQDRVHVLMGTRNKSEQEMMPYIEFDAQIALNAYDSHRRKTMTQPWNACRGGDPLHVLSSIAQGIVPLVIVNSDGYVWVGHPFLDYTLYKTNHSIKVTDVRKLDSDVDKIKLEIFEHGPVVLGINAQYMKLADSKGFLPLEDENGDHHKVGARNHAVTAVGWKYHNGHEYWILRNSWGKEHVPKDKPSDMTCVGIGENTCKVDMETLKSAPSLPGYVYAPIRHSHFREDPSPWFVANVTL